MIWILFYYNSLPDMPDGCSIFSPEIMHRDFFMCNPTNTGHYQYPRFETLSYDEGCHCKEVKNFLKKADAEKYVVFYTRNTNLNGAVNNKVVGYFKVGCCIETPKKGFFSSENVLLPKDQSIGINYSSRGVPVSWGYSSAKNDINRILSSLKSNNGNDISAKYQAETLKIMKCLQTPEGRRQIIDICENCKVKNQCYWGRLPTEYKEDKLNKLYGKKSSC